MAERRKLAAILAADVAGYSRLIGADEDGTLARMRSLRSDLIDPAIAVHNGRVVKRTGDGALVEFLSVVEAVRCAIEVQKAMIERNAGLPTDRRIEFRIGVHLGDVVEESDGDLMGDGVNIAARLEGVASPGTICLSEDAYRQVRSRLDLAVSDLGETLLKNIAEPMRIYSLQVGAATTRQPIDAALPKPMAMPNKPSIAILPFQNMSGDPAQEYLADGLVDEIITALSRLRWLFVIARNSSFAYKGRAVDVKQAGRELGVRYILGGSVRKAGNRIRISAQLADAALGSDLWADRFEGAVSDIFDLEDQVTAKVVGGIAPRLEQAEMERATRKPTQNLDAWECFVRGLQLYSEHSDVATKEALTLLRRAVELDPRYSQAYGLQGVCLAWRVVQGWESGETPFSEAKELADHAISIDPHEMWGHLAHGFVASIRRSNLEAVTAVGRAIDSCPNYAWAHGLLGAVHALGGRPDQAIECIDHALRLSPRDVFIDEYYLYYSFAHFQAGRYAEAATAARRAIQLRPGHPVLFIMAAASLGLEGRTEEARQMAERLVRLVPEFSVSKIEQTFSYCLGEDRRRLAIGLKASGLQD